MYRRACPTKTQGHFRLARTCFDALCFGMKRLRVLAICDGLHKKCVKLIDVYLYIYIYIYAEGICLFYVFPFQVVDGFGCLWAPPAFGCGVSLVFSRIGFHVVLHRSVFFLSGLCSWSLIVYGSVTWAVGAILHTCSALEEVGEF